MRIFRLTLISTACFLVVQGMAQSDNMINFKPDKNVEAPYKKFSIYLGAGPSYFFNNVVTFKDDVNSWHYQISLRFMWEPPHSKLSLGFETGYYRLYTADAGEPIAAHVSNSAIPFQLVATMRFNKNFYASWSMGQNLLINTVDAKDKPYDFNASAVSLSDGSATLGYKFAQKPRLSYAVETKFFYSASFNNSTVSILFLAGFKL